MTNFISCNNENFWELVEDFQIIDEQEEKTFYPSIDKNWDKWFVRDNADWSKFYYEG
jgi:hypothetical protein